MDAVQAVGGFPFAGRASPRGGGCRDGRLPLTALRAELARLADEGGTGGTIPAMFQYTAARKASGGRRPMHVAAGAAHEPGLPVQSRSTTRALVSSPLEDDQSAMRARHRGMQQPAADPIHSQSIVGHVRLPYGCCPGGTDPAPTMFGGQRRGSLMLGNTPAGKMSTRKRASSSPKAAEGTVAPELLIALIA